MDIAPVLWQLFYIAILLLGFGFVVFIHELGHFLAAKWVGIKVEQFAVGMGQAICSWRSGMGFTWGSSNRKLAELERKGEDTSKYGETEYRLNWVPLGGYVKMLGQDDTNPNAVSDDPRSYNRKSVGARMVVISAGVVMNVILAALLFMALFLYGFRTQPAIVGGFQVGSPAQQAGMKVGDTVQYYDGTWQHSFDKLRMNTALSDPTSAIPVRVERDGQPVDLTLRPERAGGTELNLLGIGVKPVPQLRGLDPTLVKIDRSKVKAEHYIFPGEVVVEVAGLPVTVSDDDVKGSVAAFVEFDRRMQASMGKPVPLTVQTPENTRRQVLAEVQFELAFAGKPFHIGGMQPRPVVGMVQSKVPVEGKLMPGDIITGMTVNGDTAMNLSKEDLIKRIQEAGRTERRADFIVERGGKSVKVDGVVPTIKTAPGKKGLGISLNLEDKPVIAGLLPESPAAAASVIRGALITHVDGKAVNTWPEVHARLKEADDTAELTLVATDPVSGKPTAPQVRTMQLNDAQRAQIGSIRYTHQLDLREVIQPRKTDNPLVAAGWGVTETRDLLQQFYITLHRLAQRSVPVDNLTGPIGIVHMGTYFAGKGPDWLIWFLAMISANLAVVNFLPIPIMDGGHFVFLLLEKLTGRPPSQRTQAVATYVGLALLLSIFLFVTYNDIARLIS